MRKTIKSINVRQSAVNFGLIMLIIFITVGVMLLSFANKAAHYSNTAGIIPLTVEKKEYIVTSQTIGTVVSVSASIGQHVKKGDELGKIENPVLDKQIQLLQTLSATNPSAAIELVGLQTQKEAQHLYAPTDGVVAEIGFEGEAINTLQKFANIYSDSDMVLSGNFSLSDYDTVQRRSGNLTIKNERLNSTFPVVYSGTRQSIETKNNPNANVTLIFSLVNSEDAANFLQNEKVKLQLRQNSTSTKPADRFVNWFKSVTSSDSN